MIDYNELNNGLLLKIQTNGEGYVAIMRFNDINTCLKNKNTQMNCIIWLKTIQILVSKKIDTPVIIIFNNIIEE